MRHYFVDEAGDATLFDTRGNFIAGTEGCSHYFVLGLLDIGDPVGLGNELQELRGHLMSDPYFANVPSMQPAARKTALVFHAKDDVPEVRREVLSLLRRHEDFRFLAVVRNKHRLVDYVRQRNAHDSTYRYHPNELYDYMVRRLFKNLLHKEDAYVIYFAKRGKQDRTAALRQALDLARERFFQSWGIRSNADIQVRPCTPPECAGLQAADYFLWALQRLYERREDRYVDYLRPAFRLVYDLDDTRCSRYGVYYTRKKPLALAALEDLPGI
jgi:hypothetical protein